MENTKPELTTPEPPVKLKPLKLKDFDYPTYYNELVKLYNEARNGERPMSEAFFKHTWKELLQGKAYMELLNTKPRRDQYIGDELRYNEAVTLWEYKHRAKLQKLKPTII